MVTFINGTLNASKIFTQWYLDSNPVFIECDRFNFTRIKFPSLEGKGMGLLKIGNFKIMNFGYHLNILTYII